MTPPPNPRFVLTMEALPDPLAKAGGERFTRDPAYRLKLLLKYMLRALGFRCVNLAPVIAPPPPPA